MTTDMKNTFACLALAALVLCSCGDAIEIPKVDDPVAPVGPEGDDDTVFGGDVVFTASLEALPDGSQPAGWTKGTTISVYDGEKVLTVANEAEDGPVGRFPARIKEKADAIFAITPAVETPEITGNRVKLEIPTTQTTAAPAPAFKVAKSRGNVLYFRNLVTIVNISAGMEGVDRVEISAGDTPLAGEVQVDYSGEDPVVTATSPTITLTGTLEMGKSYPVVLAPVSVESYSIVAYSGEKAVSHVSGANLTLERGQTLSLPALTKDLPAYQISHMWLWGGTGPEYNCTKIYDMFNKSTCFNDKDGRGINALKDNYLVFNPDGTFRNWAGADGRNWWFVLNASANPETGKEVDLKKFYDVLPRSTGKYSINESAVTFTKPDGSVSNATLVPAGTYAMPGTIPEISVTITTQALMFQLAGKDNWDYPYQDYGVFACHPRALFIELVQMEDGFIVPEASRTTDADFEYTEPGPGGDFDWNSLPGTWNVQGGNSAPYGLWVLGGSGNDPAFVSPIDKNWDWNSSIWRESDNELVITVTGMSGTRVSGTLNWKAGADGEFWDYIWNSTGEDLSRFYDKIPKGESAFSADIATQEVTLSNGETPKFLTPGIHSFAYGKTKEIPEGCFALAFHLMDPISVTADHYKDVDRFINAPLEYVIIFEKP